MRKCIFFDLDGTLLDTLFDLAEAGNAALAQGGRKTHPREDYKRFVGSGLTNMMRRAAPEAGEEEILRLREVMIAYYREHLMVFTQPYPGMKELVQRLHQEGYLLVVCTNKPQNQAELLANAFFPGCFAGVYAQREDRPIKPDPWAIREVCGERGLKAEDCLLVGDSDVDALTAQNGGIPCLGVAWGFRGAAELKVAGADFIVQTARELEEKIRAL